MDEKRRILLCLRYGIGDAVMEMPALRGLRRAWPDAELQLLGAKPTVELFEQDPDFQRLICVQDFGFNHWGDLGDPAAVEAFRQWFLAAEFSLVIDPHHAVYGVQDVLTGSGLPWRHCEPPLAEPVHLQAGLGAAAIWREALRSWKLPLAADAKVPPAAPFIPEARRQAARARLAGWSDQKQPLVGLAPIASSPLKRWPPDRMVEVARWLLEQWNARLLIFGLSGEQALAGHLKELGGDQLKIMPRVHLQETAALLACCHAFVSNDTGLMHLAAAAGAATVGIFGPTAAHLYLPPESLAAASDRSCPYRLHEQFGPPACVHAGRCLIGEDSCIANVEARTVTAALSQLLADCGTEKLQATP